MVLTVVYRVEGRGPATIHDVNLTTTKAESKSPTSPELEDLLLKKSRTEKALERCTKSIAALEGFLDSVKAEFVKSGELVEVMKDYDASAGQLEDKSTVLKKELDGLEEKIREEQKKVAPKNRDDLGYRVSVGVNAQSASEVDLVVIYGTQRPLFGVYETSKSLLPAVSSAGWKAAYDIRVDTFGKEKPVKLIYKAVIANSTKEVRPCP